ncbi:MAG: TraR/DksA family transcriptional regulator [Xanthomonadales bacterium]|nr:TraR/DksA family transcriptional regulator [Xanthomonadales bacterium]
MKNPDLKQIRDRLEERREELQHIARSGDEAAGVVELDQTRVGRLSRMDAMQQQAMARATRERRKAELKRIDAALERIDEDDYGLCVECGDEIAAARLMHDPSVALCIDCAEQQER